jgi:hypothetical protein
MWKVDPTDTCPDSAAPEFSVHHQTPQFIGLHQSLFIRCSHKVLINLEFYQKKIMQPHNLKRWADSTWPDSSRRITFVWSLEDGPLAVLIFGWLECIFVAPGNAEALAYSIN